MGTVQFCVQMPEVNDGPEGKRHRVPRPGETWVCLPNSSGVLEPVARVDPESAELMFETQANGRVSARGENGIYTLDKALSAESHNRPGRKRVRRILDFWSGRPKETQAVKIKGEWIPLVPVWVEADLDLEVGDLKLADSNPVITTRKIG